MWICVSAKVSKKIVILFEKILKIINYDVLYFDIFFLPYVSAKH